MNDDLSWRSTGLSDEKIKPTKLSFKVEKISLSFNSSILAQEKITYTYDSIINGYVVYSLCNIAISTSSDSIPECLLGVISLSNNKYTGCGISFSSKIYPHKDSGKNAKNLTIFGVDLSSLSHTENEKNNILVLG